MKKRGFRRPFVSASWIVVAMCGMPGPASSQADSTLIRVRLAGVDSLDAGRRVFYSPGRQERASSVAGLLGRADSYLSDQLGVEADFSVAVLDEVDWAKIWPFPYGLPYLSLEAPWVAVLPASPELSVLFPDFAGLLGHAQAEDMVDNIGFHEVGHVYVSEFVYAGEVRGPPPVRWFDEFLATYLAYSFLAAVAPDRIEVWDDFVSRAVASPEPRFTSLADFESEYYEYLGSPEGTANYGWYQAVFAQRAAVIYARGGPRLPEGVEGCPACDPRGRVDYRIHGGCIGECCTWLTRVGRTTGAVDRRCLTCGCCCHGLPWSVRGARLAASPHVRPVLPRSRNR